MQSLLPGLATGGPMQPYRCRLFDDTNRVVKIETCDCTDDAGAKRWADRVLRENPHDSFVELWSGDRLIDRRTRRMPGPTVSSAQCRAARALLRWTQAKLALEASVARKTVADFECGRAKLHHRTRRDITVTLERAGVEFVWENGECVRLARPAKTA